MDDLFQEQSQNVSGTEKRFLEVPEVKLFIEAGIPGKPEKSILEKRTKTFDERILGMIGKAYCRAGITGPYSLNTIINNDCIRSAIGTIREANSARSCMRVLGKFVKWLQANGTVENEYSLPEIVYHKDNLVLQLDYAKQFNPLEHVKTKIMRFVCLLAADLGLKTGQLCGLKGKNIDIEKGKLCGVRKRESKKWEKKNKNKNCLSENILTFLSENPNLLQHDEYILSINGKKMSEKTLVRRFNDSLSPEFRGKLTLQAIGSKALSRETTIVTYEIPVRAEQKTMQMDLFQFSSL